MKPLISVVLSAYNAEKYIYEAIESILNQTYTNFELIIINDGSSDNTEEVILSFKDPRIRYIKNKQNRGLIYSLNRGLSEAQGKYIARMDADDYSLPERFAKQVKFLEENSDYIICGGQIEAFGDIKRRVGKHIKPTTDKELKEYMFISSPFAHPTVMMRKSVLDLYNLEYDKDFKDSEDYKLWVDLSDKGLFYNLEDVLLKYRISESQITQRSNIQQQESARKVRRLYLSKRYPFLSIPLEINIEFVKHIKQSTKNNMAFQLCLLSCYDYNINIVYYSFIYLLKGKIDMQTMLRLLKRFIKGSNPLI